MKRLRVLLIVMIGFLALTACDPAQLVNGGWTKARSPNRSPVVMANPSAVTGYDLIVTVNEINQMAGWNLIAMSPVNDPHWLVHADIRFGYQSPICRNGTSPCNREPYWVQKFLKPDGSMDVCAIWHDPWYFSLPGQEKYRHQDVLTHEVHHCLGFEGDNNAACADTDYRGIGSYCNFWNHGSATDPNAPHGPYWYDSADVQSLINAGYR